ncbi:MAG: hypothetical protein JXB48_11900 [Candidatus Latescibacteria bacterium]|nr:hypothetical protein [Candidatus Latescibacterota bacterium]
MRSSPARKIANLPDAIYVIAVYMITIVLFFPIISAGNENKTGNVSGMVRDAKTQKSIFGARIRLGAGLITYCVTTDNTGKYSIEGIPGGKNFPMKVLHKDYLNEIIGVSIQPGADTRRDIDLYPVYLRLLYPNGGESIFAGSEIHILWVSVGITSVRLEFSINGGKDWQLITEKTEAPTGRYIWDVPDMPSTQYLIRITNVSDNVISDISDGTFKNSST